MLRTPLPPPPDEVVEDSEPEREQRRKEERARRKIKRKLHPQEAQAAQEAIINISSDSDVSNVKPANLGHQPEVPHKTVIEILGNRPSILIRLTG